MENENRQAKIHASQGKGMYGAKDLEAAGIPKGTLCRALSHSTRPETVGKIARALGVDVTEIIVKEESNG